MTSKVLREEGDTEMTGTIYGSYTSSEIPNGLTPFNKGEGLIDGRVEGGNNFDKIFHGPTSYEGINVTFYKSRETGLKVMVADAQIPIVHGYLTVPTEILDDSGCPHVLTVYSEFLLILDIGTFDFPRK